jgi:two-component system, NarL family, response regulator NreC
MTSITVYLIDDQAATRTGLRMRLGLESDLEIVGDAADAEIALKHIAQVRPDVIVMDVAMPGMDGIMATEQLRTSVPETAVVILSLYDDADTQSRSLEAGAWAFVSKQATDTQLLDAIRSASTGQAANAMGFSPTR